MNKNNKILAIIPARGGSKGIFKKNIKLLCGKPLLYYTARAALRSKLLSRIILTSDDNSIIEVGKSLGLETPFIRPKELSQDDTPSLPVFQHVLNWLHKEEQFTPEIVVILQPTSPLRNHTHIDEAIELYQKSKTDSLVSVIDVPHHFNPYSVMKIEKNGTIKNFLQYDEMKNSRFLKPSFYARNGAAIYIVSSKCLMKKNSIFGDNVTPYFMSKEVSVDIDDQMDFEIAEMMLKKDQNQ